MIDPAVTVIKPGTRVVKCNTEPGDAFKNGAKGVVIAVSFRLTPQRLNAVRNPVEREQLRRAGHQYCVVWDDAPGEPIEIGGRRIAVADE